VLEAILQARDRFDGSIGIRCSCRQAICGSCGVRINGEPALACHTHLDAAKGSGRDGVIEVEPMGNMPVLKDLIVDMDAVHWKKIRRVTPWLLAKQPVPEREYIVEKEAMVDVTQTMACIQCGACVSDCLAMEVDPGFIGPAALAKAYRFVGDPRDAERHERLEDLSQDPQGIYDCTHCFKCVEACPKDVNPMGQIMRLRRIAGEDEEIVDANNGHRHEQAFTSLIRDYGLNHEAELLSRSYGGDSWFGKFHPAAAKELLSSLPIVIRGVLKGKMNPKIAILGHKIGKDDLNSVKRIYQTVESRPERYELNLYISGEDEDNEPAATAAGTEGSPQA
jgi:succinate dehydrogenase / fumarate reductase iron-sulfur subunit